jgi:hypothetical protein
MSRGRRYRIVGIVLASLLGIVVTLTACSNGGEGDRCQAENGNEDCTSPLVCRAATQKLFNGANDGLVNPPFNNSDRCCPANRATATHPACTELHTSGAADGGIPPAETGPTPDAQTDSPADTSTPDAAGDADADD